MILSSSFDHLHSDETLVKTLSLSEDGYEYTWRSNVSTSSMVPRSSEGPNEHDIALLPGGEVMAVFRTGAGRCV